LTPAELATDLVEDYERHVPDFCSDGITFEHDATMGLVVLRAGVRYGRNARGRLVQHEGV
jgi:hypothetical protein